jgi:hypothetical protein
MRLFIDVDVAERSRRRRLYADATDGDVGAEVVESRLRDPARGAPKLTDGAADEIP